MADEKKPELTPEQFHEAPVEPHERPDLFPTIQEGQEIGAMYVGGELWFPAIVYNTEAEMDDASRAALDQVNAPAERYNREAGAHNAGVMALRAAVNEAMRNADASDTNRPDQNDQKQ